MSNKLDLFIVGLLLFVAFLVGIAFGGIARSQQKLMESPKETRAHCLCAG